MATVKGIAIRTAAGAEMIEVEHRYISTQRGLEDDARRRPGRRQVTLLGYEQWLKACADIEQTLPWTTRRANILVAGIEFNSTMLGRQIQLGNVLLKIEDETVPCYKMDNQAPGLKAALTPDWRGGVCCRVISEGDVNIGAPVSLIEQ